MKTFFLVFFSVLLAAAGQVYGQGDAPDCSFCTRVCDAQCSEGDCGTLDANWVCTQFTVPCDTVYQVTAQMDCYGSTECGCKYFAACVLVFDGIHPGPIAAPHTHNCSISECTNLTSDVPMKPNLTYTLCVAKIPCPDLHESCDVCGEDDPCKAWGRVYFDASDTCPDITCN